MLDKKIDYNYYFRRLTLTDMFAMSKTQMRKEYFAKVLSQPKEPKLYTGMLKGNYISRNFVLSNNQINIGYECRAGIVDYKELFTFLYRKGNCKSSDTLNYLFPGDTLEFCKLVLNDIADYDFSDDLVSELCEEYKSFKTLEPLDDDIELIVEESCIKLKINLKGKIPYQEIVSSVPSQLLYGENDLKRMEGF